MDFDDEEYRDLLAQWGLGPLSPAQEPMRGRRKTTTNPSRDDLKVRRRNNRRTATETFDGGDVVQKIAALHARLAKATSLAEQAQILDEIGQLKDARTASVRQGKELDLAETVVRQTLAPVRTHEFHTAATDWMGYDEPVAVDWQNRVIAEAASWYGRVPDMVKADRDEFAIQAQGKAQKFAGQFGLQAVAAAQTFTQYVNFLRTQGASGLDQIQQTVDPNNSPKTTPLNPEVFDNFAPEVDSINAGVSGTESSENAPLIQEIMQGGSGMDPGAPEKPGGHSTDDELSWAPPEGMQQDTAPGWSDGDPGAPEKGGDRPDYAKQARYNGRSMAIGGYSYNLDDFRREAAAKAGGQGKAEGGPRVASAKAAAKCRKCTCDLSKENRAGKGLCKNCAGRKSAASGLPMIQETIDANNQPHTPTPIPPEVGFPLDDEFQPEWTTNGTGDAQPQAPKSAQRKQADMWGASDAPHAVVQPNVANTPQTTPPLADAGGRGQGVSDANMGDKPSFSDDSTHVAPGAQAYAEGYASVDQDANTPTNPPVSEVGVPNAITHAGAKVSSLIVTAKEHKNPDFKKGYGYGSRWESGTVMVSLGSSEFEAGLYAGLSDNAEVNQRAFAEVSRATTQHPFLAQRITQHKRITQRIAAKNEHPSNGLYLTAATSIELDTMAPNTSPAADGSTPINGPGRPGPLDGQQEAAAPGGPAPYNGAQPFGTPVVPGTAQQEIQPSDTLVGGGGMSTGQQALAFRRKVQAGLLAERQGK